MPESILYWKGCMSRLRTKSISDCTQELLDLLKIDYDTLGDDEGCCGSVLLRTGQVDDARRVAAATSEKIKSGGYTEIVTSCPGCYKTMSHEYPQMLVGGMTFRVRHISQFLFEHAEELRPHLHPIARCVIYHDPCHLGRFMGVYEEPRLLIKMVPGVNLVEFKYNRAKSFCCGSGGGVRSVFPEISREVAISVLETIPKGVEILITSCPFCNYNFREAKSSPLEVLDLPEFLIKSCRGV
jgi:Fe-S oxidoreductase